MKYEEMKKEELVRLCKKKDNEIFCKTNEIKMLEKNKEINEDGLIENIHLKEEIERLREEQRANWNTMDNMREQIRVYENCLDAMSRIRGE